LAPSAGVESREGRLRTVGFETYDRAEEMYQADVEHLNAVASYVADSNHGDFLRDLADAWLLADSSDKRILFLAWAAIVTKYSLEVEVTG